MLLSRPLGPGLERLKANALCSQRSRIMGHHFFITASSSVTSIGIFLHSHDGHPTASINATAGSPPKPANALSERNLSSALSHPTKPTLFAKPKSGLETLQLMP